MTDYKDYKKLCAELVEIWDNTSDPDYYDFGDAAKYLVIRARDALAEPEEPTDEELDELAWNWYSKTGSTWWQVTAFRAFARAVLARWGR